jgi:predicted nucleic acid-binding Zn finger protein
LILAEVGEERLKRISAKYSRYGRKLDQALKTVLAGGVKEHRFLPSGRTITTVVGSQGDEFVDPRRPYCSCSHFFFRVLGRRDETCYHLLSHNIALELGRLDVVRFDDAEYGQVFATVLGDVFGVLERSSGSPSLRLG